MINVTKTKFPPIEKYINYLKGIWKRGWITNHGPLVNELEEKLKKMLGVKHLFLVANGTLALQIAIKALGLKKEIITTPFSYIATTSSIVWEGCDPIFADIDPNTLTINPSEIERKITSKTSAILATHVYGNPCLVDKISKIARKNNLKVIYDASHAFGVAYKNKSIFNYGDISTLSLHATKIFHSVEGGVVITNNAKLAHKIFYMRNFGHVGKEKPEDFYGLGINGKMSELHAAMGLCLLPDIRKSIIKRKKICDYYDKLIKNINITRPIIQKNTIYNFSYYPVIFPTEESLLKTIRALNKENIFPRRYFKPSLTEIKFVKKQIAPFSLDISKRILCLPLYEDLSDEDVKKIINLISKVC